MPDIKKAALVVDDWKLPIFRRVLGKYGYEFEVVPYSLANQTTLVRIYTTDLEALKVVMREAADEAEKSRGAKP